jgi:hypothetical protein
MDVEMGGQAAVRSMESGKLPCSSSREAICCMKGEQVGVVEAVALGFLRGGAGGAGGAAEGVAGREAGGEGLSGRGRGGIDGENGRERSKNLSPICIDEQHFLRCRRYLGIAVRDQLEEVIPQFEWG